MLSDSVKTLADIPSSSQLYTSQAQDNVVDQRYGQRDQHTEYNP